MHKAQYVRVSEVNADNTGYLLQLGRQETKVKVYKVQAHNKHTFSPIWPNEYLSAVFYVYLHIYQRTLLSLLPISTCLRSKPE